MLNPDPDLSSPPWSWLRLDVASFISTIHNQAQRSTQGSETLGARPFRLVSTLIATIRQCNLGENCIACRGMTLTIDLSGQFAFKNHLPALVEDNARLRGVHEPAGTAGVPREQRAKFLENVWLVAHVAPVSIAIGFGASRIALASCFHLLRDLESRTNHWILATDSLGRDA